MPVLHYGYFRLLVSSVLVLVAFLAEFTWLGFLRMCPAHCRDCVTYLSSSSGGQLLPEPTTVWDHLFGCRWRLTFTCRSNCRSSNDPPASRLADSIWSCLRFTEACVFPGVSKLLHPLCAIHSRSYLHLAPFILGRSCNSLDRPSFLDSS
jgi:hypothetical protein